MKKLADRSKEVTLHKRTLFGTVGRWPRPLNRGGRLMEVVSLLIYNKYFRDFDNWPLNREWPLNGEPLNGGSTVFMGEFISNHCLPQRIVVFRDRKCAKSLLPEAQLFKTYMLSSGRFHLHL